MGGAEAQMFQAQVEGRGDGILQGAVQLVCKLIRVESWWESGDDVVLHRSLKALHDDGSQCYRAEVVQVSDVRFLRHWNDGSSLET